MYSRSTRVHIARILLLHKSFRFFLGFFLFQGSVLTENTVRKLEKKSLVYSTKIQTRRHGFDFLFKDTGLVTCIHFSSVFILFMSLWLGARFYCSSSLSRVNCFYLIYDSIELYHHKS